MKRTLFNISSVICFFVILAASCKKSAKTTSSCTSTLHAFTAPTSSISLPWHIPYACMHGIINPTTASIVTSGTVLEDILFTTHASFNSSNNCYYLFQQSYVGYNLYKVDAAGTVTTMTPTDTYKYNAVAYNHVTNKLYSKRNGFLVTITEGTSTYSTTNVASPVHPFADSLQTEYSCGITVDNTIGDMYFLTGLSSSYYVEKYHPGSSTTSIVATLPVGFAPFELSFNKADNMLYSIRRNSTTGDDEFIKINPATGTVTSLANLGPLVNVDIYSATLDPCSNRYIISTLTPGTPAQAMLYQINMSGAIVQHDSTATFYQGLDVTY
jgi:hypothetical protein